MFRTTKEIILSKASSSSSINASSPVQLNTGSIFYIGNATVLIRYAGLTILTDPTFIHIHEKVNLGFGLYTTRLTNPAMNMSSYLHWILLFSHISMEITLIRLQYVNWINHCLLLLLPMLPKS